LNLPQQTVGACLIILTHLELVWASITGWHSPWQILDAPFVAEAVEGIFSAECEGLFGDREVCGICGDGILERFLHDSRHNLALHWKAWPEVERNKGGMANEPQLSHSKKMPILVHMVVFGGCRNHI
jgi:hypothetical protein